MWSKVTDMTQPSGSTLPDVTWLTVPEVAEYLNVARMTVYRWIAAGKLPAVRLGDDGRIYRIDERHVEALLQPVVGTP